MILLLFFVLFLEELEQGLPSFLLRQMFPYFSQEADEKDTSILSLLTINETVTKERTEENNTILSENSSEIPEETQESALISSPQVYSRAELENYDFLLKNHFRCDEMYVKILEGKRTALSNLGLATGEVDSILKLVQ